MRSTSWARDRSITLRKEEVKAAKHVDLGLILPGRPVGGRLESSATFNALFTHRVRIASIADVDEDVVSWIRDAYRAAA
jgi:hypothetical protein